MGSADRDSPRVLRGPVRVRRRLGEGHEAGRVTPITPAAAIDVAATMVIESAQLEHDQQRAVIDALAVVLAELRDGGDR